MLTLLMGLTLSSCYTDDDVVYIDCDCGYIDNVTHVYDYYGHYSYDVIEIYSDCGYIDVLRVYNYHYEGEYVCYYNRP